MGISKNEAILKLNRAKNINVQIKHIDRRILELKSRAEYAGINYTDLPKAPKKSYKESAFDKCLERTADLEEEKTELLLEIDTIMEPFFILNDYMYKTLCLKYIKKLSWYEISKIMSCDERTCKRYGDRAFKVLAGA